MIEEMDVDFEDKVAIGIKEVENHRFGVCECLRKGFFGRKMRQKFIQGKKKKIELKLRRKKILFLFP